MKNKGKLIAAAVVLLALIGCIVLINNMGTTEEEPQGSPTPVPTAASEHIIYKTDVNNVASIKTVSASGELIFTRAGEEWTVNGIDIEDVDTDKTNSLVSSVTSMYASNFVADTNDTPAEYGFDNPILTVSVELNDGTVNEIIVGGISPTLGEYFITSQGGGVYTVTEYFVDSLMNDAVYYQTFARFSVTDSDIAAIHFDQRDMGSFTLEKKPEDEQEIYSVWTLTGRYARPLNAIDDYVDENILTPLSQLSISTPARAGADMGLDNPRCTVTITVTPFDQESQSYQDPYTETIKIGNAVDDVTFVEYKGKNYEVSTSSVDFAFIDQYYIVSKLALFTAAVDIDSVEINFGDTQSNMEISGSENALTFKLNGSDMDSKAGAELYQEIIGLTMDKEYSGETLGEQTGTITFNGRDDSSDMTVVFYSINDREYAVSTNGEIDFIVTKANVQTMLDKINEAAA